ncbi:MAG: PIN domain-containing protein [Chitinivibrionales bacterium]|nr:PIN domain-containing protein [Chitinivibrionales bacterium]
MNIMLDTHILLWWLDDPAKLTDDACGLISSGSNNVYISSAVIWEIVLKKSLGKLEIPPELDTIIQENRFQYLPVAPQHAFALEKLPNIHRDPFDRILIAQALHEKFTFITRDAHILRYDIETVAG